MCIKEVNVSEVNMLIHLSYILDCLQGFEEINWLDIHKKYFVLCGRKNQYNFFNWNGVSLGTCQPALLPRTLDVKQLGFVHLTFAWTIFHNAWNFLANLFNVLYSVLGGFSENTYNHYFMWTVLAIVIINRRYSCSTLGNERLVI